MDGIVLGLFLLAAFLGGFASGLAGFAMGFIVSAVWLHFLTPLQTTTLIVGYSICTQGYGVWKLRRSLNWRTIAPFIAGGAVGVPIGTWLLTYIDSATMRSGVGVMLVIYGAYGLTQPAFRAPQAGVTADGSIGFLNGVLCGLTGLPGFIITVWCQFRGWAKDVQRAVFQPVMLAASTMTGLSLLFTDAMTWETGRLYLLGLPPMLGGLWVGFKLYGKLDEASFRKVVLVLLLCAGLALIAVQRWPLMRPSSPAAWLVSTASAGPVCRPVLAISRAAFSKTRAASMERRWTATVTADVSQCASTAGYFELGFLREKENAPPLEFREQFIWSEPSSLVGIDVWADEAIEHVWIDSIQPCPCRERAGR